MRNSFLIPRRRRWTAACLLMAALFAGGLAQIPPDAPRTAGFDTVAPRASAGPAIPDTLNLSDTTTSALPAFVPDTAAAALTDSGDSQLPITDGYPVVFGGETLFVIHGRTLTAEQRAERVSRMLEHLLRQETLKPQSIRTVENDSITKVVIDTLLILGVTDADAAEAGMSRAELARQYAANLTLALKQSQKEMQHKALLIRIGLTLLILVGAAAAFRLLMFVFPKIYGWIGRREGNLIRAVRLGSYEIISAPALTSFFTLVFRGVRFALALYVLYFVVTRILALYPTTRAWDVRPAAISIALTILLAVVTFTVARLINAAARGIAAHIPEWKGTLIRPVRIHTVDVLSADRIAEAAAFAVRIARFASFVLLAYVFITLLFSFFAFTQTWSATLFRFITVPLGRAISAFVHYLPSLFTILVVVFIARYAIKLVHWIFSEIGRGTIPLPGFYKEWAEPTYKIARFLIMVFALIVIFPYLPGSDSKIFQGISLFVGLVFSLGSTSAIANIVAGVIMTYMRPFTVGDRVKIADTMGDIVEKTLLVTRVRTIKNVDVTIPNAMVLGSHIINFSSSAQDRGLILHTGVTIGYDVPWRQIHELLISAARATEHILQDPPPFVLQTSLDDFYVSYELNAVTNQPAIMAKIYSQLHQNIQDKFFEAGVEIMSPHYGAVRDGNPAAIPNDYLPKHYKAPGFRLFHFGESGAPRGSSGE